MFIKVGKASGRTVFVNLNQVAFVDKELGLIQTSDGNIIFITDESLRDVLDGIGYNYDEED